MSFRCVAETSERVTEERGGFDYFSSPAQVLIVDTDASLLHARTRVSDIPHPQAQRPTFHVPSRSSMRCTRPATWQTSPPTLSCVPPILLIIFILKHLHLGFAQTTCGPPCTRERFPDGPFSYTHEGLVPVGPGRSTATPLPPT